MGHADKLPSANLQQRHGLICEVGALPVISTAGGIKWGHEPQVMSPPQALGEHCLQGTPVLKGRTAEQRRQVLRLAAGGGPGSRTQQTPRGTVRTYTRTISPSLNFKQGQVAVSHVP